MIRRTLMTLITLLVLLALAQTATSDEGANQETLHRFAFIAGSNDGGANRVPLRYAQSDAKSMARVLRQLGGVDSRDTVVLFEPDRFDFEAGLARMHNILLNNKQSGMRQELVFYFSGHSDEQGLLLGDDWVSYRELREAIQDLPADVKIAILDSCASGVLTREKGGMRRAPFLMDDSVEVQGHAFLTSASADEAAQESDRVGGSFFTHYLVSGLRGAADNNSDKKVTLNEAYQYAFHETLARTESTQAGPQHPGYDFQLKGSGDLVLTDLRGTSALVELSADVHGRIFIRDRKGQLVAEINKQPGQPMSLGLDPGRYEVSLEKKGQLMKGYIVLEQGAVTRLNLAQLTATTLETTVVRGPDSVPPPTVGRWQAPWHRKPVPREMVDGAEIYHQPFRVGIVPHAAVPYNSLGYGRLVNNFSLNFIGLGDYLAGGEIGAIGNIRRYNVKGYQGAGIFNEIRGNLYGYQTAGIFSITEGKLNGGQVSGIFSTTGGDVYGIQAGGIFTLALGETIGFKAAGIYNFSAGAVTGGTVAGIANIVRGPMKGIAAAGILNVNTRTSHGFQSAGIVNINGASASGFQGAGFANINADSIWGFQHAGIFNISALGSSAGCQAAGISNYAESLHGAQLAGILNVTRDRIQGAQIGLVNVGGHVQGAQIGLVNIATRRLDGASVGLVNYAGNGILAPTIWWSDSSFVNLGLKMGGPHLYGILGTGISIHPVGENKRYSFIGGFGGHISMRWVWLDIDVIWQRFFSDRLGSGYYQDDQVTQLRPALGVRVIDQLSLYIGPTLNLLVSDVRGEIGLIPSFASYKTDGGTNLRLSLGFIAGLQWEPKWGDHNSY